MTKKKQPAAAPAEQEEKKPSASEVATTETAPPPSSVPTPKKTNGSSKSTAKSSGKSAKVTPKRGGNPPALDEILKTPISPEQLSAQRIQAASVIESIAIMVVDTAPRYIALLQRSHLTTRAKALKSLLELAQAIKKQGPLTQAEIDSLIVE